MAENSIEGAALVLGLTPSLRTASSGEADRGVLEREMLEILLALKQIGQQEEVDILLQALHANGISLDPGIVAHLATPIDPAAADAELVTGTSFVAS